MITDDFNVTQKTYHCKQCGALFVPFPEQASMFCPNCLDELKDSIPDKERSADND